MPESGHHYRFSPPRGGWPTFDDKGRVIDKQVPSYHKVVVLTKVSHSGQRRIYYKGACACGWEAPGWRVSQASAEADFRCIHLEKVS